MLRNLKRVLWRWAYLWRYRRYMKPGKPLTTAQMAQLFREHSGAIAANVTRSNALFRRLRDEHIGSGAVTATKDYRER